MKQKQLITYICAKAGLLRGLMSAGRGVGFLFAQMFYGALAAGNSVHSSAMDCKTIAKDALQPMKLKRGMETLT